MASKAGAGINLRGKSEKQVRTADASLIKLARLVELEAAGSSLDGKQRVGV